MLETGIFGLAMIVLLFWLVFLDSIAVAREDDSLFGAVAAGWIGVVALMAVSITYNSYHDFVSVTYLYAYFSGVICARRMMLAHAALERHPVAEKAGLPLTS
jgi:cell division protein FtsW (lipid II flippase)